MVLVYVVVLFVILVLILRRDLSAIGKISYRGGRKLATIVASLFVLQAVTVLYSPGQTILQITILISSQVVLIFLILLNRYLPGAKLFVLGIILNTTVMLANGGWMPVTPETHRFVHPDQTVDVQARPPSSKGIILPRTETRLWVLSDIIRVTLPWRRNAVSIGDLLLVLGAAHFIFQVTSKRGEPWSCLTGFKEPQTAVTERLSWLPYYSGTSAPRCIKAICLGDESIATNGNGKESYEAKKEQMDLGNRLAKVLGSR